MAPPRMHTDAELLAAYEANGESLRATARSLKIARSGLQDRLRRIKSRQDPAIAAAQDRAGTRIEPSLVWVKTASEDGTAYSVLLRPQRDESTLLDRIRDAFADMEAIPKIAAPIHSDEDLLTLYPLADLHMGMLSWGRETGEDYDLKLAQERVISWVGQAVASAPASKQAIILDVGDLTHADDQTNQTPKGRHGLDVDTRHFRTIETVIASLAAAVEIASRKHEVVTVRILPGNHNPHSYMAIMFALAERYRDNPRVSVQTEPGEFFAQAFGRCLIAAHHGDKAKAQSMVLFLADQYAEMWGQTRHRFLWTGHLHHHKSQDIGGVQWEQLRAMVPRDAYAVSHAYTSRAQLQAITYHRDRGEIHRVKVGM